LGDAIARARLAWLQETNERITREGFTGFRRSDTAIVRQLRAGPSAVVDVARTLHVSRQAARKALANLEERGFVTLDRDPEDARRTRVTLTTTGRRYAATVIGVSESLNAEVGAVLDPHELDVTLNVLRRVSSQW
jgi:DNA-binding MarR family transcriptional regulator